MFVESLHQTLRVSKVGEVAGSITWPGSNKMGGGANGPARHKSDETCNRQLKPLLLHHFGCTLVYFEIVARTRLPS